MGLKSAIDDRHAWLALALATAMAAVVGGAWMFQWIGYVPCKLCLAQREPYYWAIPLVLLGGFAGFASMPACVTRGLALIGGLLMIFGATLAIYHSGVEWSFWAGPTDCGAVPSATSSDAGNLFATLNDTVPPACDEAAGRFLGLSFAGWNVIASIGLAMFAIWLARLPAKNA